MEPYNDGIGIGSKVVNTTYAEPKRVDVVADVDRDWIQLEGDLCWRMRRYYKIVDTPNVVSGANGAFNSISKPEHYVQYKIEPLTFIMANDLPFWMGNVIKYIMRHEKKDGLKDLKKARQYLDEKIKELETE